MFKRKWLRILKIGISFLLIWVLFQKINLDNILVTIHNSDKTILLLAFALASFNNLLLSPYKWKNILQAHDINIPLLKLSKSYLVGIFFNMFMPGITGGDLVKAHDVSKLSKRGVESYISVFIERATGMVGLFANSFLSLFFAYQFIDIKIIYLVLALFAVFLAIIWLIYNRKLMQRITFLHWISRKLNLDKKLKEIYEAVYLYKTKKIAISYILLLSFFFHFGVVVTNYMIAAALGIKVSFIYFWLFIPLVQLISMIPISINGIGVRDISYVTCLKQAGIPGTLAFSISLIAFGMGILLSSIGGVVYALRK